MANASAKRIAISNKNQLRVLHNVSYFIYGSVFLYYWSAGEPYIRQLFFALPGIIAEVLLDKWCKPKFGPEKKLISPGLDVNQPGLVEYTKDLMILNWFILLLSVAIGAKAWYTLFVVPIFLGWKAFQLLKAGKNLLGGGQQTAAQPAGAYSTQTAKGNSRSRR